MNTKIRNFRITPELDTKLVETAERLDSDPSSYLRSLVELGWSLVMHQPPAATHEDGTSHEEG